MKFTKLFMLVLFLIATAVTAQDISDHTIGLRLGDSDGFGAEISYQKSIDRYKRAEINLGYRDSREFDAFKLVGVLQWVHSIDSGFNWYYGFGGGIGNVSFEPRPNFNNPNVIEIPDGGFFVLAAGNIGIEYDFDSIPLLISLDFRPEIGILGFGGFDNNFDFDIGLGLRYQF